MDDDDAMKELMAPVQYKSGGILPNMASPEQMAKMQNLAEGFITINKIEFKEDTAPTPAPRRNAVIEVRNIQDEDQLFFIREVPVDFENVEYLLGDHPIEYLAFEGARFKVEKIVRCWDESQTAAVIYAKHLPEEGQWG